MAEDWAADVKKHVPDADETLIAAIVRYCGIALQKRDSSLVSFSDPAETARVRDNFLKKKLGLTQSDDVLDAAIASVGEKLRGDPTKNRVTVYYLLTDHFGAQGVFKGAAVPPSVADTSTVPAVGGAAAAVGIAGAAAVGLANLDGAPSSGAAPVPPIPPVPLEPALGASIPPAPEIAASSYGAEPLTGDGDGHGEPKGGFGWLWWLLLVALLLALLWWFFLRHPEPAPLTAANESAPIELADNGATLTNETALGDDGTSGNASSGLAAAPAEGTATIPTGAGVTAETREGKPVVKVYFDTAKSEVAPGFGVATEGLKAYLAAHAGSALAVSGFNDKTGNAAANAELSKKRAQAVKAALVSAGIPDASVALVKPSDTTDTSVDDNAARRVEVVVR